MIQLSNKVTKIIVVLSTTPIFLLALFGIVNIHSSYTQNTLAVGCSNEYNFNGNYGSGVYNGDLNCSATSTTESISSSSSTPCIIE